MTLPVAGKFVPGGPGIFVADTDGIETAEGVKLSSVLGAGPLIALLSHGATGMEMTPSVVPGNIAVPNSADIAFVIRVGTTTALRTAAQLVAQSQTVNGVAFSVSGGVLRFSTDGTDSNFAIYKVSSLSAIQAAVEAAGGGSLAIEDEGTALTGAALRLNFTGAGVTAEGTGAEKTITIPGGAPMPPATRVERILFQALAAGTTDAIVPPQTTNPLSVIHGTGPSAILSGVEGNNFVIHAGTYLIKMEAELSEAGNNSTAQFEIRRSSNATVLTRSTAPVLRSDSSRASAIAVVSLESDETVNAIIHRFSDRGNVSFQVGWSLTLFRWGGGGLTLENDGVALDGEAIHLNFAGEGVTVTGTGFEKTITIPGGAGGSLPIGRALTLTGNITIPATDFGTLVRVTNTGTNRFVTLPPASIPDGTVIGLIRVAGASQFQVLSSGLVSHFFTHIGDCAIFQHVSGSWRIVGGTIDEAARNNVSEWAVGEYAQGELTKYNGGLYSALRNIQRGETDNPGVAVFDWGLVGVFPIDFAAGGYRKGALTWDAGDLWVANQFINNDSARPSASGNDKWTNLTAAPVDATARATAAAAANTGGLIDSVATTNQNLDLGLTDRRRLYLVAAGASNKRIKLPNTTLAGFPVGIKKSDAGIGAVVIQEHDGTAVATLHRQDETAILVYVSATVGWVEAAEVARHGVEVVTRLPNTAARADGDVVALVRTDRGNKPGMYEKIGGADYFEGVASISNLGNESGLTTLVLENEAPNPGGLVFAVEVLVPEQNNANHLIRVFLNDSYFAVSSIAVPPSIAIELTHIGDDSAELVAGDALSDADRVKSRTGVNRNAGQDFSGYRAYGIPLSAPGDTKSVWQTITRGKRVRFKLYTDSSYTNNLVASRFQVDRWEQFAGEFSLTPSAVRGSLGSRIVEVFPTNEDRPPVAGYNPEQVILHRGSLLHKGVVEESVSFSFVSGEGAGFYVSHYGVSGGVLGHWIHNSNSDFTDFYDTGHQIEMFVSRSAYRTAKGSNEAIGDQLVAVIQTQESTPRTFNLTLVYQGTGIPNYLIFTGPRAGVPLDADSVGSVVTVALLRGGQPFMRLATMDREQWTPVELSQVQTLASEVARLDSSIGVPALNQARILLLEAKTAQIGFTNEPAWGVNPNTPVNGKHPYGGWMWVSEGGVVASYGGKDYDDFTHAGGAGFLGRGSGLLWLLPNNINWSHVRLVVRRRDGSIRSVVTAQSLRNVPNSLTVANPPASPPNTTLRWGARRDTEPYAISNIEASDTISLEVLADFVPEWDGELGGNAVRIVANEAAYDALSIKNPGTFYLWGSTGSGPLTGGAFGGRKFSFGS